MSAIYAPTEHTRGSDRRDPRDAAVSEAVARCRPVTVGPAGSTGCDVIAAAIDASSTGRPVYAEADPDGLLRMAPSLFRSAHLGLPIVLTVWPATSRRDHAHAMALRDCGWIQLYPSDDQDAVDTHIQAFRIAERLSLPVMVCTDRFEAASHCDPPSVPCGSEIDAFLERRDRQSTPDPLTASDPLDMYTEWRYRTHAKHTVALDTIRQAAADFRMHFGRASGGALTTHKVFAAELGVVGLGSTFEAITAAVDDLRRDRVSVGAVGLRSFRPFPAQAMRATLLHCPRVVIVERAIAVGIGGIVATDVRAALARLPISPHTVIAGLGEEQISPERLQQALRRAANGRLEELSFLDVNPESKRNVQQRPGWC